MQRFIEGVRNFELKRNLAHMYAPEQEQYVEAPPTVEALRFTVQQYLRMRGSSRSDNYQVAHTQPQQANQQPNQPPAAPPPAKTYKNSHLNSRQPTNSRLSSQQFTDNSLSEHAVQLRRPTTLCR